MRRQVHRLARDPQLALLEVELELADLEHRLGGRRGPPQHRAQAGDQLVDPDRLRDVVVGARVERGDLLALVADRGEHDHRRRAPGAQLAARPRCRCRPGGRGRGSPPPAAASPPRPAPSRRSRPCRPRSRRRAGSSAARAGSAARRRRPGSAAPLTSHSALAAGSASTKVAPWPGRDSAQTRAPFASAKPRAIARPSPAPRAAVRRRAGTARRSAPGRPRRRRGRGRRLARARRFAVSASCTRTGSSARAST